MNCAYYQSPVGLIRLEEREGFITSLSVVALRKNEENITPLLTEGLKQLDEYFSGKRFCFDLPLKQEGTPFQKKAWEYLQTIPYASTVTYKDEALAIGSGKAFRAAGSANGKNKIAIIVPCHRVVGSDNKPGGYAYGIEVKKKLLDLEKKFFKDGNR